MEKRGLNKIVVICSILCSLVLLGVLGSYAYFMGNLGITKNEEISTETGSMSLIFSDGNNGIVEGSLEFGGSIEKTFNIQNNGTIDVTAKINWDNLTNTYLDGSLTYTLSYSETQDGEYTELITDKNVPRSENPRTKLLASNIAIPKETTYYYKLKITLNYLDDVDQTPDLKAMLSTQFSIEEFTEAEQQNIMMARVDNERIWAHSADIKTIVFEPSITEKPKTAYTYDLSQNGNGKVMGKLVPDEVDSTKYTLYIQADRMIYANEKSSRLFQDFTNLEAIKGMQYFDTSNVTNMNWMFLRCSNLTLLDVSNFDTSNVTDMSLLFSYCTNLTSLDVSNFDTSNVTNMNMLFYLCSGLTTLDVSNFDTSNVTNMSSMFARCTNLTSLDVSNFDTSNVTRMDAMFAGCSGLAVLNVSNFDTSKAINMDRMFSGCSGLTMLDVSNFDTGNVTNMDRMFSGCSGLTALNVSNFDTSKAINMDHMFSDCSGLTTLDLSNFNTSNVTDMKYMFNGCNNLTTLDVSNFDTSNVTDMERMFNGCSNLMTLDLSNFNTSKVTIMFEMFVNCRNLTATITIRGTSCNTYNSMFTGSATNSGASITVNYTADASSLVNSMIATKSNNSNVKKGVQVS